MKIIYTMKKCNEKSEGFHIIFSYEYFYSVALWNVSHPPVSLSTTHIQALDIQCTLWSPKYTPNDILDISKNYHLLLRYLYLPYTLHWYFFLVMQSSRILEGFLRSSFKSSAFLFSLSLSNMALAWNCCQLTFQFFLSNHAKKALAKRLSYLFYVDES